MPIEFACESCARLLRVPDGSGGLLCECPACQMQLIVPDPNAVGIVESAQDSPVSSQQIRIACPQCEHALVCSRQLLGTKGQCRNCQYIFVISESAAGQSRVPTTSEWLFNCPNCQQLFEGQEEMRGRKGKCHNCGKVFVIELRRVQQNVSTQPVKPAKTKTPTARNPPPQMIPLPAIQLTCTSCRGVMEVPGDAAGQTTACPFCQKLLQIPHPGSKSRSDST